MLLAQADIASLFQHQHILHCLLAFCSRRGLFIKWLGLEEISEFSDLLKGNVRWSFVSGWPEASLHKPVAQIFIYLKLDFLSIVTMLTKPAAIQLSLFTFLESVCATVTLGAAKSIPP